MNKFIFLTCLYRLFSFLSNERATYSNICVGILKLRPSSVWVRDLLFKTITWNRTFCIQILV